MRPSDSTIEGLKPLECSAGRLRFERRPRHSWYLSTRTIMFDVVRLQLENSLFDLTVFQRLQSVSPTIHRPATCIAACA